MKKILIVISIIIIALVCIALIIVNTNKKSQEELCLDYLNNTYYAQNDTFTFINNSYSLFPGSNDKSHFKSKKYNSNVEVKISKLNNEYHFEDNYYKLYMSNDAKLYFENIASNLNNCEVKIRFGEDYLNEYLTFEDYNNNVWLEVFYITNYDIEEHQKQEILNKISSNNRGIIKFYVTTDSELLNNIDLDTILNNQSQYIKSESEYYIDSENNIEKSN